MGAKSTSRYAGLLICLILLAQTAVAKDTGFVRVNLAYGISLDVPEHWDVLSKENRKNIAAAGVAIAQNAGADRPSGSKEPLLAVNATPNPAGATIRVSVTSPSGFTQSELAAMSSADLKEIEVGMLKTFKQTESAGGPKIIEMQPVRIEMINGYRVLILPYLRVGAIEPSPWQVTQYKIPVSNRMIEITLSHRMSDAVVWRPILERVKRSVIF